ncbi:MAG: nuclear transport factor 2 family protein [Pseudanabaena sp.]|jgi:hypothetical protein|nr:nuclear transport factor 2 family protein [Pseudanabaena sp. M007S1SP1A06QC]
MLNVDVVNKFFECYKAHDYQGMHSFLDKNVKFSDFAFYIQGNQVKAMWHWFCVAYQKREEPVDVTKFEILRSEDDIVEAKYRVSYLYGDNQRPVIYFINSRFLIQNDKIVEQVDTFGNISESKFAEMALGFPSQLLALRPKLLRTVVNKKANEKLNKFMKDNGY